MGIKIIIQVLSIIELRVARLEEMLFCCCFSFSRKGPIMFSFFPLPLMQGQKVIFVCTSKRYKNPVGYLPVDLLGQWHAKW